MKKKCFILLSLLIVVSMLVSCTPQPTQTEPSTAPPASSTAGTTASPEKSGLPLTDKLTTITVLAKLHALSADPTTMNFLIQMEKDTNVRIEGGFISPTAWEEKKNIALASGELPDMFLSGLSKADIVNYGEQGYFIPLDNLIEEYAPNIVDLYKRRPQYRAESIAPNGVQYYIKGINELKFRESGTNLFINKKWLDRLGLKVPETYDEYYTVLKAFKTSDPNGNGKDDEIPLTFNYSGGMDYNHFFNMFGGWGYPVGYDMLCVDDNKQVIFAPMGEHFAEALKYFKKLYTEGLIDQEVFTQNTSVLNSKGKNPETILGSYTDWFGDPVVGAQRFNDEYVVVPPMAGPYARLWRRISGFGAGGTAVITSVNKYPELSMKWINHCFDPMISLQLSRGPIGEVLELKSDGLYHAKTPPEGMSDDEFRLKYAPDVAYPWALTAETLDKVQLPLSFDRKLKVFYPANKPYLPENFLPDLMFTKEESDRIAIYKADIETYVHKMIPQFITGHTDIDSEWANFTAQLEKMGVREYVKLYQDCYNRFLASQK